MGKNGQAIKEYIANQLKYDKEADKLSIFDPRDPFTGKWVTNAWLAGQYKGTCATPVKIGVIPENEKTPARRVDIYFLLKISCKAKNQSKKRGGSSNFTFFCIYRYG